MHPLDTEDRIPSLKEEFGSGYCNITRCCTDVCPEHINITDNAIIPLKERVVDRYYDPLWELLQDLDCSFATHEFMGLVGTSAGNDRFESFVEWHTCVHPMEAQMAMLSMIAGGVFERFPRVRVAYMEAGSAWVPWWLHRIEEHVELAGWLESPHCTKSPFEYFKQMFAQVTDSSRRRAVSQSRSASISPSDCFQRATSWLEGSIHPLATMPCSAGPTPVSIEACTLVVTAGRVGRIVRTPPFSRAKAAMAGVCGPISAGERPTRSMRAMRRGMRWIVLVPTLEGSQT